MGKVRLRKSNLNFTKLHICRLSITCFAFESHKAPVKEDQTEVAGLSLVVVLVVIVVVLLSEKHTTKTRCVQIEALKVNLKEFIRNVRFDGSQHVGLSSQI